MAIERLPISDINLDFHGRASVDEAWVETLAKVVDQLPPPRILRGAAGVLWAVDGVHTLKAAASLGLEHWECEVTEGTEDDARLTAAKANLDAGNRLPLTDADKRRKVQLLLGHRANWSDGKIAEHLGVSQPFVSKVRRELTQFRSESRRIGRDGRTIDTSKIGKVPGTGGLEFVRHAASTGRESGFLAVAGGRVSAASDHLAASAPFGAATFDFRPRATEFFAALDAGRGSFDVQLLPDGRVAVSRGDLTAPVTTLPLPAPEVEPSGAEVVSVNGDDLLATLIRLEPWTGDGGLLLTPTAARTSNFRAAVSLRLAGPLFDRDLRLPRKAVRALVDINESPIRKQEGREYLTLYFPNERWLRVHLLPDNTLRTEEAEVDRRPAQVVNVPLPHEALEQLAAVVGKDKTVVLCAGAVSTIWPAEAGVHVRVPGLPEVGAFPLRELLRLEAVDVLAVEPDGDGFFEDGDLRGRLFRQRNPDPPGTEPDRCEMCGQELPP